MGEIINFKEYNNIKIKRMEQEMKNRYGYYIHYVSPDKEGELIDCHTHGLMEYIGHKDIQIKTKISNELANKFINNLVYIMKETGKSIFDINIAPEGLNPIKYKELRDEFGKDIIRLIIPDTNGKYPWDKDCKEDYKKQWTMEDELNAKK